MRDLVKVWLAQNDIIYDKLIFLKSDKEKKLDEIFKYKIDLMVEDNPTNIAELSTHIPVICYDTSYNKDCQGKNIIRCYTWYDLYKTIKDLSV